MRNSIILFFVFLGFSHYINGQYQRIFDPATAPMVWNTVGQKTISGGIGMIHFYYFGVDSLIQGRMYKKDTVINGERYDIVYNSMFLEPSFMQEDTVDGKVTEFFFDNNGNIQSELIVLNLSLNVGDTITYPSFQYGVVDSVYHVLNRKHVRIKHISSLLFLPNGQMYTTDEYLFIEGVGNTKTISIHPHLNMEFASLVCYTNVDSLLYMASYTDTCWLRGLHAQQWEETQSGMFSIYPNPVNDILHISTSSPFTSFAEWRLTDARGKTIRTGVFSKEEEIIDISALPAGLYFIQTQYENKFYSHKIIKQ